MKRRSLGFYVGVGLFGSAFLMALVPACGGAGKKGGTVVVPPSGEKHFSVMLDAPPSSGIVPVMAPNAVRIVVSVTAGASAGRTAHSYMIIEEVDYDGVSRKKYFVGSTQSWVEFSDNRQVKPFLSAPLADVTNYPITIQESTEKASWSRLQLSYCVSATSTPSFDPYDATQTSCDSATYMLIRSEPITSRSTSGSLEAASVLASNDYAIGSATSLGGTTPGRVAFDLRTRTPMQGALILAADPDTRAYPNADLAGVKIDVYSVEEDGGKGPLLVTMGGGKVETPGLRPKNGELLNSPAYDSALRALREKAGMSTPMPAAELRSRLANPETTLENITPNDLEQLRTLTMSVTPGLFQAVEVPFPFRKIKNGPIGLLVVKPSHRRYRVEVEAAPGAMPFAVNALLVPFGLPSFEGVAPDTGSYAAQPTSQPNPSFNWAALLDAERWLDKMIPNPPPIDVPPDCKKAMSSKTAKLWSEVLTSMLHAGIGGLVGRSLGIGEKLAAWMGAGAGDAIDIFSGGLQGVSDWIEFEKEFVRFYTINAFLPVIETVDFESGMLDLCVDPQAEGALWDDKTSFRVVPLNPCGQPIWGFGESVSDLFSSETVSYVVSNPMVGDLIDKGYARGFKKTKIWGAGKAFEFRARNTGTTLIMFYVVESVTGTVFSKVYTVDVHKCASPTKTLSP